MVIARSIEWRMMVVVVARQGVQSIHLRGKRIAALAVRNLDFPPTFCIEIGRLVPLAFQAPLMRFRRFHNAQSPRSTEFLTCEKFP